MDCFTFTSLQFSVPTHGSDLPYIIGQPVFWPFTFNENDLLMREKMTKLWANFAKTGYASHNICSLFFGSGSVKIALALFVGLGLLSTFCTG